MCWGGFHSVFFLGPAAFCQRSQRSVAFTLSTEHAEQSGACPAALEEAGPGAEEVCVRPSCRSQLDCLWERELQVEQKNKSLWQSPQFISPPNCPSVVCISHSGRFPGEQGEEMWMCRAEVPVKCTIQSWELFSLRAAQEITVTPFFAQSLKNSLKEPFSKSRIYSLPAVRFEEVLRTWWERLINVRSN